VKEIKISVVGPVYNEESCVEAFYSALKAVFDRLPYEAEFIFVDDGSSDRTPEILARLGTADSRMKSVHFSRNFGHQIAIKAGLDHASGDAVIFIDTDLQDPPEAIPSLLEKWREGYDVVYAVRESREGEGWFKKATAALYYRLTRALIGTDMPLDTGDYRLVSGRVAEILRGLNEKRPYLRGLVSWVGFRQVGVPIRRAARGAGESKYSLRKMLEFAWSGIAHFSFAPLHLATAVGLASAAAFLLWLLGALLGFGAGPGEDSLILGAVLFFGAVQLVSIGILGTYVARGFDEARGRPLYLVKERRGFEEPVWQQAPAGQRTGRP
jgi:dolichol-phosphate mannosyltransferase